MMKSTVVALVVSTQVAFALKQSMIDQEESDGLRVYPSDETSDRMTDF